MNCSKTCWLSMKADIPNPKTSDGFGSAAANHLLWLNGCSQPKAVIYAKSVTRQSFGFQVAQKLI